MKLRPFGSMLSGTALFAIATVSLNQPGYGEGETFLCQKSNNVSKTYVRTQDGKNLPLISWSSEHFPQKPHERCKEVSRRFQQNYDNRTLRYIKAGTLNRQPVVCAAAQKEALCTEKTLLFTLKQGSDADAVARQLFDRRALAAGKTINQVGGDTSKEPVIIDVDAFLYFSQSQ